METEQKSDWQKMLDGEWYNAYTPKHYEERYKGRRLQRQYNETTHEEKALRMQILKEWLGSCTDEIFIEPPFYVDYGCNIRAGHNFYANFDCMILDCAKVTIGDNVKFGPRVQLYTPSHPVVAHERNKGLENALTITIGDNCWLGGGCIVCPGVTIGENTTIGAGSVVTKDIPPNVMAAGMESRSLTASSSHRSELDLEKLNIFSEKWNIVEHIRSLAVITLCLMAWFTRILIQLVPQGKEFYGLTRALESISHNLSPAITQDEQDSVGTISSGAIGRSLAQVLALVNDLPASSKKYAFTRALAEKIIYENSNHGYGYESVNRIALSAGFKRTLTLLTEALQGLHLQRKRGSAWSLPLKLMSLIPSAGMAVPLPAPLSTIRSKIGGYLDPALLSGHSFSSTSMDATENAEFAEKLGQELLWLAEKLADCSSLEEGLVQWSSASPLASLALTASPRVQRSLVRLSALLTKEVVMGKEVATDVRFKLLLLWIPLFCTATHGIDGVIFSTSEKIEVERTLEKAIRNLPEADQEVILAIWLQEFALSSSDWPNLQSCYDAWCHSTRKLSVPTNGESGCGLKDIGFSHIE
ncbi:hypothetical protein R1sor_016307 [Riccia sorocarpa]|uniref:Maltose/galactoside acetyltransferase domain-containing protein n=1 Tax=Riccia sorocarpa TaxID=122646 RepID=A0ABD3HF17_9MARC